MLNSIGITAVTLTGDSRYDRVLENKAQLIPNENIVKFVAGSSKTLIAGSIWEPDLNLLKQSNIKQHFDRIILAPHNIDQTTIKQIESAFPNETIRFTQFNETDKNILILDTIGHLASAYSYGNIAYVGGGFSGSLHNILEPAVFGLPVIFGPKHKKFPEANHFQQRGIGFSVETPNELNAVLDELQGEQLKKLSSETSKMVLENAGAARKIGTFVISNQVL